VEEDKSALDSISGSSAEATDDVDKEAFGIGTEIMVGSTVRGCDEVFDDVVKYEGGIPAGTDD
jgi:hypothetical protein